MPRGFHAVLRGLVCLMSGSCIQVRPYAEAAAAAQAASKQKNARSKPGAAAGNASGVSSGSSAHVLGFLVSIVLMWRRYVEVHVIVCYATRV